LGKNLASHKEALSTQGNGTCKSRLNIATWISDS
jgi:hypothetical protein